ncbi:MAG: hypothetical protein GFH27_549313n31 [Chloroflexi bacterium AL-W]|nr:hypothetical protein [Chloroflexi bacterium AL-N1]NOK69454.1 hypothetical protein [Chloroflexi bacterium AL-N10]NOK77419.1 hypothetical protein [Chloroflexi bacterium AL-N5]NOK84270.1 hypothetical protein [Chloroflexi bacterium AL-W]NOK91565.1 hypothetical protein [Chloroflexi bacterium AL-N15]
MIHMAYGQDMQCTVKGQEAIATCEKVGEFDNTWAGAISKNGRDLRC